MAWLLRLYIITYSFTPIDVLVNLHKCVPYSIPLSCSTFGISLYSKGDARPAMLCSLLSTMISSKSLVLCFWLPQSSAHMVRRSPNRMNPHFLQQTVTNGSQNDTGTHLQSSMWPWTDGTEGECSGEEEEARTSREEGQETEEMEVCWVDRIKKKNCKIEIIHVNNAVKRVEESQKREKTVKVQLKIPIAHSGVTLDFEA